VLPRFARHLWGPGGYCLVGVVSTGPLMLLGPVWCQDDQMEITIRKAVMTEERYTRKRQIATY